MAPDCAKPIRDGRLSITGAEGIMATWQCVKNCGACCQLDPGDRPDLPEYLSGEELALYLSLVGEDGWCIHFNQNTRECGVYEERPGFCRVQPDTFSRMFGIEPEELNEFASRW